MKNLNSLSIFSFLIFISLFSASTHAATFSILNNCPYTVWAAALPASGWGMDRGQTVALNVNRGTSLGRIWGKTNCSFDNHDHGTCLTGDCANRFRCTTNGTAPKTTAEFSLDHNNRDTYHISLVDGYNVPMEFRPESGSCRSVRCNVNILGECPNDVKRPGGCINPCTLRDCGPTGASFYTKNNSTSSVLYQAVGMGIPTDIAASRIESQEIDESFP